MKKQHILSHKIYLQWKYTTSYIWKEDDFISYYVVFCVNCCAADGFCVFLRKHIWSQSECMFRIWLCNTSEIYSYSCSQSLSSSLLLSDHIRGRAACSFSSPTVKDSSRFVGIPCLLFHVVPGWGFSRSSLENLPYKWVLCAQRCWTCPRLRHDYPRCYLPSSEFCPSPASVLDHAWFSDRCRYLWSQPAASNMSEYCSFQTHHGICMSFWVLLWRPAIHVHSFTLAICTPMLQ